MHHTMRGMHNYIKSTCTLGTVCKYIFNGFCCYQTKLLTNAKLDLVALLKQKKNYKINALQQH